MYIGGAKVNEGNGSLNLATVQTALDQASGTVAPNTSLSKSIDIRLELPLTINNTFKGDSVGSAGAITAFDVSSLFTIVATQENNPGWTEAGN